MQVRQLAIGLFFSGFVTLACSACNGGGSTKTTPPCDQMCEDDVGARAIRETLKQVFNGALQSKPVGAQDVTYACSPLGGTAHVTGTATSNADVGTTSVDLTYVLDHCHYVRVDNDPTQSYDITLTGTIVENGTIAVQPGQATSLSVTSDDAVLSGNVYSPPLAYDEPQADDVADAAADDAGDAGTSGAPGCEVTLAQNGNQLSGTICGRAVGLNL